MIIAQYGLVCLFFIYPFISYIGRERASLAHEHADNNTDNSNAEIDLKNKKGAAIETIIEAVRCYLEIDTAKKDDIRDRIDKYIEDFQPDETSDKGKNIHGMEEMGVEGSVVGGSSDDGGGLESSDSRVHVGDGLNPIETPRASSCMAVMDDLIVAPNIILQVFVFIYFGSIFKTPSDTPVLLRGDVAPVDSFRSCADSISTPPRVQSSIEEDGR